MKWSPLRCWLDLCLSLQALKNKEDALSESQKQEAELRAQVQEAEKQQTVLQNTIEGLEKDKAVATQEKAELDKQLKSVQEELAAAKKGLIDLNVSGSAEHAQLEATVTQNAQLEKELKEARQNMEKETRGLRNTLAAVENKAKQDSETLDSTEKVSPLLISIRLGFTRATGLGWIISGRKCVELSLAGPLTLSAACQAYSRCRVDLKKAQADIEDLKRRLKGPLALALTPTPPCILALLTVVVFCSSLTPVACKVLVTPPQPTC